MAENQLLNVSESTPLGKVEIAPDVLEVIAGIATTEVSGVSSMRGNFATGVAERLGKKAHGKGIKVDLIEEINVHVVGVHMEQVNDEKDE